MDRRYSTLLVLAVAALFAEACSSSSTKSGTGGAGGGSSIGGATGTGGKTATGGATGAGGVTGAGGKTDGGGTDVASTGGVSGTGGKTDGGGTDVASTGGATGTDANDAPVSTDTNADADPAQSEKALCATTPYMSLSAPPFTAVQFCTLYREICNNIVGARVFATEGDCETAYSGYSTDPDAGAGIEGPNGQKGCRTDHLCLANVSAANAIIHCPHTTGLANGDAGPGGPCP